MPIRNRMEFLDYCLRRLGQPVIKVNVAPNQMEDRIDDAIQWWNENCIEGSERDFLVYKFTQDDIDNKCIDLSNERSLLTINSIVTMDSESQIEKILSHVWQYKASMADMRYLSMNLTGYYLGTTRIADINWMLAAGETFQFSKVTNKLKLNIDWSSVKANDSYIVLEVIRSIEEDAYEIWNDATLKDYATALIKRQWGENLKKHEGIQLIGGMTLNGQKIWEEAIEEINRLQERVDDTPIDFFYG